jgi:transposase
MAMELSTKSWGLVFGDGGTKRRRKSIEARDWVALGEATERARKRFGLPESARVVSCYEAGREGFSVHRELLKRGVANRVVDSSSIEVQRRGRRKKTDRVDGEKLLKLLLREAGGERDVWRVVRVPSEAEEDARRPQRELERLGKERTAHRNRLQGLLFTQGIAMKPGRGFVERVSKLGLGGELQGELEREYARLQLVQEQIRSLEREQRERLKGAQSKAACQAAQLMKLKGLGETSGWRFATEFFAWREFRNRREVGALAGLVGTPYNSGQSEREQGISKAGNQRVRKLAIEIAWQWLRHQPESKLSVWFNQRYAQGGKRMRRVGIVAVARRLLVALWRYLEHGVMPEGAQFKAGV